ncbi:MAG: hypothetical protein ACXWLJ_05105 [Rhizomicrobium sp.]
MIMPGTNKEEVLAVLRAASRGIADEVQACRDIEAQIAAKRGISGHWNPKQEIDECVYALALVFSHHTGSMPAYTNGERPTLFEQFLVALPLPAEYRMTRNRIKAAIRRLDAKRNPAFKHDLHSSLARQATKTTTGQLLNTE